MKPCASRTVTVDGCRCSIIESESPIGPFDCDLCSLCSSMWKDGEPVNYASMPIHVVTVIEGLTPTQDAAMKYNHPDH